jgi:nucleoside-diphosphate-sugar epimerase
VEVQETRVLVTGGAGFIGSHLLQLLLAAGAHVRAFVHYNSLNHRGFIDILSNDEQSSVDVVKGDLRDPYTVGQAVKNIDMVFHLGALIAIPYSYQSDADVVQTNVFGTSNVAQAAVDAGVSTFIHTSTSEVYGTAQSVPMNESHVLQGQSPYSASKIASIAELLWMLRRHATIPQKPRFSWNLGFAGVIPAPIVRYRAPFEVVIRG